MNIRSSEKEKTDDLNLHGEPLHKTLQSLEWVNRWFGILISSHFMYHFTGDAMVDFLKKNSSAISTAFIFSELKRNSFVMRLCKFSHFLLPISNLAKEDSLPAIKRSFTEKEWLAILQQAGISTYRLQSLPLSRILLTGLLTRKI